MPNFIAKPHIAKAPYRLKTSIALANGLLRFLEGWSIHAGLSHQNGVPLFSATGQKPAEWRIQEARMSVQN